MHKITTSLGLRSIFQSLTTWQIWRGREFWSLLLDDYLPPKVQYLGRKLSVHLLWLLVDQVWMCFQNRKSRDFCKGSPLIRQFPRLTGNHVMCLKWLHDFVSSLSGCREEQHRKHAKNSRKSKYNEGTVRERNTEAGRWLLLPRPRPGFNS